MVQELKALVRCKLDNATSAYKVMEYLECLTKEFNSLTDGFKPRAIITSKERHYDELHVAVDLILYYIEDGTAVGGLMARHHGGRDILANLSLVRML